MGQSGTLRKALGRWQSKLCLAGARPARWPIRESVRRGAAVGCLLVAGAVACWADDGLNRAIGKALFDRQWVPAPSSTKANDGLGPLFNARSCAQCHGAATAGRIEVMPDKRLLSRGAVVRLSGPDGAGDPHFGAQIQTHAIPGFGSEAEVQLAWRTSTLTLADGTVVDLREPDATLEGLETPLSESTSKTLLLAPSLRAAARADKIDIKALEERPANVQAGGRLSRDKEGSVLVFGHKASERTLEDIVATAFSRDLGLSTSQRSEPGGDCTVQQAACRNAINGVDPSGGEISKEIIGAIADYVRSLDKVAAPSPQNEAEGARIFEAAGCGTCHTPLMPAKRGGEIALYSDLRLHDMGEGLAGLAETAGQSSKEWRTAALVGLGERLRAGATLMHDGRARNIAEAVLWHAGEAESTRDAYKSLPRDQREALERFLLGE